MIYQNKHKTNVLRFGSGDIEVGNGNVEGAKKFLPCMVFIPHNKAPKSDLVGKSYRKFGGTQTSDVHTMFVFTNIKSIDVLMYHLQQAKANMLKFNPEAKKLIDL